ncbi:MAG: lasso peptide biosynthesis B2 protein [Acidimicrobiales bacterium]
MSWSPSRSCFRRTCDPTTLARRLADVRIAVPAGLIAVVAPIVARLRPESMQRVLEARLRPTRPLPCSDDRALQIIDGLLWRAPWPVRNRCLVRGITAYRLLRGAGREVDLVFGARLVDGAFEAHCWLSDGSRVVHEKGSEPGFDEMFRLTGRGVLVA